MSSILESSLLHWVLAAEIDQCQMLHCALQEILSARGHTTVQTPPLPVKRRLRTTIIIIIILFLSKKKVCSY